MSAEIPSRLRWTVKVFRTKSPQLSAFLKVRVPGTSREVRPLAANPTKAEIIISPADDVLYEALVAFNDTSTQVPLQDYLHELAAIRDQIRSTIRGGGAR